MTDSVTAPPEYVTAHLREALAEDEVLHQHGLYVEVFGPLIRVSGTVDSAHHVERVAMLVGHRFPEHRLELRLRVPDDIAFHPPERIPLRPEVEGVTLRVAAVGDLHVGRSGGAAPVVRAAAGSADVLLLAGDLTNCGHPDEARALAAELAGSPVPVVAVLGNHDVHAECEEVMVASLEDAGVMVLDGSCVRLEFGGTTVAIVGAKGFGGGFSGAGVTEFGEPEMKAFARHTREVAELLEDELSHPSVQSADVRIVLLHYAPVEETLVGEPEAIHPFLGTYLLGEAVDRAGADLVVHGHAHRGTETGRTPGGIPVRNVARPVILDACRYYHFG